MKYNIEIDTHCHSAGSIHAFCTVEEILEIAEKRGLKGVCITDHHCSLGHECSEYKILAPDNAYFHVFCNRYSSDSPVELLKGIEMNIIDEYPWIAPLRDDIKDIFDIKICGIHNMPHLFKGNKTEKEITNVVLSAIDSQDRPFDVLVHPCYRSLPTDIELIVKRCAEKNIAVELNNSSLKYKKNDTYLTQKMLDSAVKYNCPVAVGTDAHTANEVGVFEEALQMLSEIDFPISLVVNRTIADLKTFLKK